MNIVFLPLFLALFAVSPLFSTQEFVINWPPQVSVTINPKYENEPIIGTVKITHLVKQLVDQTSFTLDGKPFAVKFVGNEYPEWQGSKTNAAALVVSSYDFTLPPQPPGLYMFGRIGVKVGQDFITASSVTYEVIGIQVSTELGLEARILQEGTIYPGQKVTFEYRISFHKPIQLVKEDLPLLQFEGFRNVGAPNISDVASGTNTVQVIQQTAIAESVGTFHSGPSIIEGYVYVLDDEGRPRQASPVYQANAPDVVVTVASFPSADMPVSFNGALGVYHWQVSISGPSSVSVGEKIRLHVFVSGTGDIGTVQMPDLSRQIAFQNAFLFGDLAPIGQVKDGTKSFFVDLRPLSDQIKRIPSIQFSSFDPISKTYVITKSDPIPIVVRSNGTNNSVVKSQGGFPGIEPIDILGNMELKDSEVETKNLQSILLFYALCSLLIALGIQLIMKQLTKETSENQNHSRELFLEAIKKRSDPDTSCKLLTQALLLALYEQKMIKAPVEHPEELNEVGIEGEIKLLLNSIDKKRFAGLQTQVEMNEIIKDATELYQRLTKL